MRVKIQYANKLERTFWTSETQQLREGQLVGRMLLQRLATGATGVKQARYRRRPTRGSEALVRACAQRNHIKPLRCGHPSIKARGSFPNGGHYRGVPLYIYLHSNVAKGTSLFVFLSAFCMFASACCSYMLCIKKYCK